MTNRTAFNEATPLEYALQAYQRIKGYDPAALSSNEKAILALGAECKRVQSDLHRAEVSLRHAGVTTKQAGDV